MYQAGLRGRETGMQGLRSPPPTPAPCCLRFSWASAQRSSRCWRPGSAQNSANRHLCACLCVHLTTCPPWLLIVPCITSPFHLGVQSALDPSISPQLKGETSASPVRHQAQRNPPYGGGGGLKPGERRGLAGASENIGDALHPRPRGMSLCPAGLHCSQDTSRHPA